MDLIGWVFLCGGLFGVVAAHFRWYESSLWQAMDWFDMHSVLDKDWIARGKRRFYYATGVFGVLLGLGLLAAHHLAE